MLNYWGLKSSEYFFKPMFEALKQKLLTRPILHADETYYTVLESETVNTYYWVFLSGKHDKYRITLYHHDSSRGSRVALDFLGNYPGYLHCDMWQAYESLPEATMVGCWAHARRKFHDATPADASEKSLALKGLNYCNRMFRLEEKWKSFSCEERYQARQQKLKPLMQEFFDWCKQIEMTLLSNSKLSIAVNYAIRHQETFEHVLLNGNLELSNDMAERAVKSLVMGRKNWLFSQEPLRVESFSA